MTEVDTPVEITLDEEDIQALKDGETVEHVFNEDDDRKDALEMTWHTTLFSESAAKLHNELTEIFDNDTR